MTTDNIMTKDTVSFDDLVAQESGNQDQLSQQRQQHNHKKNAKNNNPEENINRLHNGVWMAMIGGVAPLMIETPTPLQDNHPIVVR